MLKLYVQLKTLQISLGEILMYWNFIWMVNFGFLVLSALMHILLWKYTFPKSGFEIPEFEFMQLHQEEHWFVNLSYFGILYLFSSSITAHLLKL